MRLADAIREVVAFLDELKDYEDVPADLRLRAKDLIEELEQAWET